MSGLSVIVTTYNWPQALNRVLSSLCSQSYTAFEIIVADDGSSSDTAEVIQKWQQVSPVPIIHCWQPDEGFRASKIRNQAAAKAKYDYLVFLDGDCVVRPDFVKNHAKLAEKGWFVAGRRVLLSQSFTQEILTKKIPIETWSLSKWAKARITKKCNRFVSLLNLNFALRKHSPLKWQGAKTCNLAIWKDDFFTVNGLDESFVGWGFEDSDLVIRLQRAGIRRKSGAFAVSVLHLWHPEQDRSKLPENAKLLGKTLMQTHIRAALGVEQYLVIPANKQISAN